MRRSLTFAKVRSCFACSVEQPQGLWGYPKGLFAPT